MTRDASTSERRPAPLARWTSPPARLLGGLIVMAGMATAPLTAGAFGAAACVAALTIATTRPSPRFCAAVLTVGFLSLGGVLAPFAYQGQWEHLLALGGRGALTLVVALGFASVQRLEDLPGVLQAVGLPRALSAVVSTMARQTTLLAPEGRRLILAWELRGARGPRLGIDVMARLLVRTARRADRLALATELRGAGAAAPTHLRLCAADAAPLCLAAAAAATVHACGRLIA